jgi:hypothetical protein
VSLCECIPADRTEEESDAEELANKGLERRE